MEWQESADEIPQANSNTRPAKAPNNVVSRDDLGFYWSTPGKTTAAGGGGECHTDTLKPTAKEACDRHPVDAERTAQRCATPPYPPHTRRDNPRPQAMQTLSPLQFS